MHKLTGNQEAAIEFCKKLMRNKFVVNIDDYEDIECIDDEDNRIFDVRLSRKDFDGFWYNITVHGVEVVRGNVREYGKIDLS